MAKLACIAMVVGCAAPVNPVDVPRDPAADGPWRVGVMTLDRVPDPVTGRPLTIEIWYPASFEDGAETETTLGIPTTSVRDAEPDLRGAPFPLIAFSHGRGGLRVQSVYLTEHLASWGYVVVAPDHPLDTLGGSSKDRPEVLRNRPHQISASIDAALAVGRLTASIDAGDAGDAGRIGVAGHSFGAFTSLVLAGAKLDLGALRAACAADPGLLVCDGLDDKLTQSVVDGFADPRIAAAVALAPAGRISFGATGLAATRAPMQIQGGTADTLATQTGEVEPIFDGLVVPRSLGMLASAAHFSFTDICVLYELTGGANGPFAFLATEGCGELTLPVERAHAASRTLAAAFFDLYLRGAPDDHGYLDPARGVPDATVR